MTTADPHDILRRTFGYPAFRGRQEEVVARVMAGQHTLAVMPTGAGKSLCYQVPALARPGTGLVVSPLIALMHDQVRAAEAAGIRAAALTSADSDRDATLRRFHAGELDLLYVAPERASGEGFRRMIEEVPLSLVAIDEAHCVSEWGHDFRPDYRLLRPLLDAMPGVPRLALTATADAATRVDVMRQLGIPDDGLVLAGFDRPNTRYVITARDGLPKQLAQLVSDTPGAGIVYATSRDATEKLAASLARDAGRPTRAYHAGLDPAVRAAAQRAFVASEDMVMAATIAFGMGIDKPDVRFVAHAGLPKSIESYYQETGRAGRDGDPAIAQLFWNAEDFSRARRRIESEVEEARRPAERTRLNALAALVETPGCRRAVLLRHFGDDAPDSCGNCDNCLSPPRAVDATTAAQKLLSAAYRTGQRFGLGHLVEVLTGKGERGAQMGHDKLSVWGIADAAEAGLLRPVARALMARDALRADEHGGLTLGPSARAILKGDETVPLVMAPPRIKKRARNRDGTSPNPIDDPLFEALRARRRDLARAAGMPPYVVFHDAVLREMAAVRPGTLGALGEIAGVGAKKLETYGPAFLEILEAHAE